MWYFIPTRQGHYDFWIKEARRAGEYTITICWLPIWLDWKKWRGKFLIITKVLLLLLPSKLSSIKQGSSACPLCDGHQKNSTHLTSNVSAYTRQYAILEVHYSCLFSRELLDGKAKDLSHTPLWAFSSSCPALVPLESARILKKRVCRQYIYIRDYLRKSDYPAVLECEQ